MGAITRLYTSHVLQSTPSRSHHCSSQYHASGPGSVRGRGPSACRMMLPWRRCHTSASSIYTGSFPAASSSSYVIVNDQNDDDRWRARITYLS